MRDYLLEWLPRWFAADGDGYAYTLNSGLGDWCVPTGVDAPLGSATRFAVPNIIAPSSTAYVAYMAKIAADSARALGQDASALEAVYNGVKADFNAKWWDASVGYYRENATQPLVQSMQILPLAFGLVPPERRRALQEKLIYDVLVTREGHQMTGIAGSRWIYPVLQDGRRGGRAGRGQGGVHDRPADDVSVATAAGPPSSAGPRSASTGSSPAARATTTCSARSGSGSSRAWPG